ncbi:MAG TPA: hypothetical protein VIT91_19280 [Chthoniobacterales bacterium]
MNNHGVLPGRPSIAAVALIGIGLAVWMTAPAAFFRGWLIGWLFWSGLSLGALPILMLQWLTGGAWGTALRRPCEAVAGTTPLIAILFIPIVFGAPQIFPWAAPDFFVRHNWPHKQVYLNLPFFAVRALIYFAILIALATVLRSLSRRAEVVRLERISAAGLIVYFLLMIFASTDWVASLIPEWRSSIFPVIFIVSQFLSSLAFGIAVVCWADLKGVITPSIPEKPLHDLGNLLLAFVIFWTYVSFAQLLLIWAGNLPKEISWYTPRSSGGWQYVALVLALLQFAVPFALLLSRAAKRHRQRLGVIAGIVLGASVINVWWLVAPSLNPSRLTFPLVDCLLFVAIGVLWMAVFLRIFNREVKHV